MGLALLYSRALYGMDAPQVTVEVHLGSGLPNFTIVGLPELEVKEARDRVRSAIINSRFSFPSRRVTVNLAPADLPKESGRFDLPIALGILAASEQIGQDRIEDYEFAGELALSGALRTVRGALPMTLAASRDGRGFILPLENADEAAMVEGAGIYPAASLLAVCAHLSGAVPIARFGGKRQPLPIVYADYSEVKGQAHAKRALEVAAAGGHSVLMSGPPGTGKSMLASRFPGILPPMTDAEALSSAAVQSLSNAGFQVENWKRRPFRAPHHTTSAAAMVGGGTHPRPGEISLAHHGVLFLDELPEFQRTVLEALREPLETGRITVSRAAQQADFPANFQLLAAMNPCPCGYLGHPSGKCHCTLEMIHRYRARISGPFLDRIDIRIEVPSVSFREISTPSGESSSVIRSRVELARRRQIARQGKCNRDLSVREVEQYCSADAEGKRLLEQAIERLNLSARAYHRVLKIARSIADLAGSDRVSAITVAEAIQYRRFEA